MKSDSSLMDIPDRVIEDARLWRFTAMALPAPDPEINYQWANPVPIKDDGRLVGFGVLFIRDGQLWAECATDYAIVPRLSVEAGTKVWLRSSVTVTPASLQSRSAHTHIRFDCLHLRFECTDAEHESIRSVPLCGSETKTDATEWE